MLHKIETRRKTLAQRTGELAEKDGTASASDVRGIEQEAWELMLEIRNYRRERQDGMLPQETRAQNFQTLQQASNALSELQKRHPSLVAECVRVRENLRVLMEPLARG